MGSIFMADAKVHARLQKHAETIRAIRANGHRNKKGEGRKVLGKTTRNFQTSLQKNNDNLAAVYDAQDRMRGVAQERRQVLVRDVAADIVKDFDDSTLRDMAQKVMADGRLSAKEIMSMFETMEDVTVAHLADAKASAFGHADAIETQLKTITTALEQETHKIIKNASRFATNLEDMGVLNKNSMLENLKHGSIHIRNHYINLGAVLMSLILMKSMRFVVAVDKKEESDDKELSVSGFTDWVKGDGKTYFGANATLPLLATFCRLTQTAPANPVVVNRTIDQLITMAQTDIVDDDVYLIIGAEVSALNGGTYTGSGQALLKGSELKNVLEFSFIPKAAWTLAGLTSTCPVASFDQTGKINVITCQAVKVANEDVRIAGGLDLAGAAKVGAWMAGTNFSDWASLITPFFSNTIGNLVTKNKLFDFLSDKDA